MASIFCGLSLLLRTKVNTVQAAPATTTIPPPVEKEEKSCTSGNKAAEHFSSLINPRNQFWRLVSALVGENLAGLPYDERLPRLLAHGFGLWDVLGACEREGSLDSAIRNASSNDFALLRGRCPALETVGFNGKTSGKFAPEFAAAGFRTVVLPSSSPAHASMSFEQKLAIWLSLLDRPSGI
jgi:hypoxanthine-DNA glycosylase